MKYEKCLTCKELGRTCDGPNFIAMEPKELGLWINAKRKQHPEMTYDWIVANTQRSKSAVFGFLNGEHDDYRLDTVRPIIKIVTGGNWDDNPCGNVTSSEKAAYEEKIRQLEGENRWRDDKIAYLEKDNAAMQTLITNTNKRHTDSQNFMRMQIKGKNKAILILSLLLGVCLAVIIAALIIDNANPDVGFFWLRSWLGTSNNPVKMIGS